MGDNIRRKRNFKQLKLPTASSPSSSGQESPVETKLNVYENISEHLSDLEMGVEFKVDLRIEDLKMLADLGEGAGGSVSKVLHVPTKTIMARKVIIIEAKPELRKQILRELQILHDCKCSSVVSYYGAFLSDSDISICMEFMDLGSLDTIYKKFGKVEEPILGKMTVEVLKGLVHLYEKMRIIHRDLKPSNILVNSNGQCKLCDFGVSGEVINSIANTFVGTSYYMSPERIQGGKYTVRSDVWSLGITLMEVALGKFPFPPESKPLSIFELLEYVVHEPMPSLPANNFSPEIIDFVNKSLIKDPSNRPTPRELLDNHPFVSKSIADKTDMKKWAQSLLQKKKESNP